MQIALPVTPPLPVTYAIPQSAQPAIIPNFTHLHVHTNYSIRDGAIKIKDLANKCRESGMTACAITDHGNMYGAIKFYKEMKQQGIKPIIGYEAYVQDIDTSKITNPRDWNRHMVLLAMNNDGYRDLMDIASDASINGGSKHGTRFAKSIMNLDYIEQNGLGKNIICLTACIAGQIPTLILRQEKQEAILYLEKLKGIFHEVFIELQVNDILEQSLINMELQDIARITKTRMVFTKDAHYLNREHAVAHDALLALQINKQLDDPDRWRFTGNDFYVTTPQETYDIIMQNRLPMECITNTMEIANMCDVNLVGDKNSYYHGSLYPDFPDIPKGYTQQSYLFKLANDGLMKFIQDKQVNHRINLQEYIDRLNYELMVITTKGYDGYFLILWDLLKFCSENSIGYSARGSGVGCLVCKCLGITKQDPIQYNLLFERFISLERPSAPDVDLDISDTERHLVIKYMQDKYGTDRVAQIITFGQLTVKSAAKEIARLSENSLGGKKNADGVAAQLSSVIPAKMPDQTTPSYKLLHDISLHPEKYQDKYKEELPVYVKLSQEFNDVFDKYPDIAYMASELEGLYNNAGNHAAGVILYPGNSRQYTPLDGASGAAKLPICQFDMVDVEELGLLKIDILGLSTMRVLHNSAKRVGINIDEIPRDDIGVYDMLQNGYTTDVFQLSGGGMTKACVDSKVSSIDDITAIVALYRPGPLDAVNEDTGKTIYQQYIDSSQTGVPFVQHPRIAPIVADAKGSMIYQEHVMRIVMEMSKCTLGTADVIRRLMGKKKIDQIRLYGDIFQYGEREELMLEDGSKHYNPYGEYKLKKDGSPVMLGAIYNGFDSHEASNMWNQMVKFGGYCFNKSHATAYADTAYQTAWLKYHYPAFYMAEVMTAHKLKEDLIASIKEAKRLGVPVLQPDVNMSGTEFTLEWIANGVGGWIPAIRFGFGKIFGISNADVIIDERNRNGPYQDIDDYFARIPSQQWNKNKTTNFIQAGCFDSLTWDVTDPSKGLCDNRLELLNYYFGTIRSFKPITRHKWDTDVKERQNGYVHENPADYTKTNIRYDFEYEMLGMYISGHPLQGLDYVPWNSTPPRQNVTVYGLISNMKILVDKNKQQYARFTMETLGDIRECIMWSKEFAQFAQTGYKRLKEGTTVKAVGRKDLSRGGHGGQFIINSMHVHTEASGRVKKASKKKYDSDYTPMFDIGSND